jgi:muconolactone delta-isomerase
MQFFAVVHRRVDVYATEEFEALLEPEAQAVRRLYVEGVIRAAWSRDDVPGACLLLEAPSLDAVEKALHTLPLIGRGMAEAQIIPLRGYRGFGPRS